MSEDNKTAIRVKRYLITLSRAIIHVFLHMV